MKKNHMLFFALSLCCFINIHASQSTLTQKKMYSREQLIEIGKKYEKCREVYAKLPSTDLQFIAAAKSGNIQEMIRLKMAGANVNAYDEHGFTALHCLSYLPPSFAITERHINPFLKQQAVIVTLIHMGADIECRSAIEDLTPLLLALEVNRYDIVDILIKRGRAKIYIRNKHGNSPYTVTRGLTTLSAQIISELAQKLEQKKIAQELERKKKESVLTAKRNPWRWHLSFDRELGLLPTPTQK